MCERDPFMPPGGRRFQPFRMFVKYVNGWPVFAGTQSEMMERYNLSSEAFRERVRACRARGVPPEGVPYNGIIEAYDFD